MFYDDLAIGKRGEQLIKNVLAARGHTVEDLTEIVAYQEKEIDFRLTDKSGVSIPLEVKNDIKSNYTGNVFVETYNRNNVKRGGDGWICYCDADYLCFVEENKQRAHIVLRSELIKNCWSGKYGQSYSQYSRGYIVPIGSLQTYESYYCLEWGER